MSKLNTYTEKLVEEYQNPRNEGKMPKYTHTGKMTNLNCGDEVELFLQITAGEVKEASHVSSGCALCVATTSLLTDHIKGMSTEAIQQLTYADLTQLLEIEVSPTRRNCVSLPLETLRVALDF